MEAQYPRATSALVRSRRVRSSLPRARFRTQPVTFAEIKEVDEDNEETSTGGERRRRRDLLLHRASLAPLPDETTLSSSTADNASAAPSRARSHPDRLQDG